MCAGRVLRNCGRMLLTLRIWTAWACGHGYRRENWSMRIRQFKLIGIIVFCGVAVICVSLLAWLDMTLAVALVLLLLVVSAVAYYRIDKKKSRFEAYTDFIYQGCNKQFVKAAEVEMPRADEEVEQAVASGTSGDEVEAPETVMAKDSSTGGQPHILVVDDVPEYRMLIEVLLSKAGYRTTLCCDGQEAVKIAEKERFDLILMDTRMPVMNGLEATRIIKSNGPNSETPVMAMTAVDTRGDETACLEAGCDGYISKPLEREVLLDKIERFMHRIREVETAAQGGEIASFLADDPSYHKMIDMFVNNLPKRLGEMQEALDEGNLQDLAFKIHTLRGLGSFAGFPIYTEKAEELEQAIMDNQVDKVREQLDEMVRLCLKTKMTHR